jgi:hypothetical protein
MSSLTDAIACNAKSVLFTGIACTQAVMSLAFQTVPSDTLVVGSTFEKLSKQTAKYSIDVLNKAMIAAGECECTGADGLVSNAAVALAHLTSTTAVVAASLLIPDSVRESVENSVDDMDDEQKLCEVRAGAERFLDHLKNNVETIEELEQFLEDFATKFQGKINRAKDAILGQDDSAARFESQLYCKGIEKAVETVRHGIKAIHAAGAYKFTFNDKTIDGDEPLEAGNAVELCKFDADDMDSMQLESSDAVRYWKDICDMMKSFCLIINVFVRMILYCNAYKQTLNRLGYTISFGTTEAGYKTGIIDGELQIDYATACGLLMQVDEFVSATGSELARKLLYKTKSDCEYTKNVLGAKDLANKKRCVEMQKAIVHSSKIRLDLSIDRLSEERDFVSNASQIYDLITDPDFREMSAYKTGDIEETYASMSDPSADVTGLFPNPVYDLTKDHVLNRVMNIVDDHLKIRRHDSRFVIANVLAPYVNDTSYTSSLKLHLLKQYIDRVVEDQRNKAKLATEKYHDHKNVSESITILKQSTDPEVYVNHLLYNGMQLLTIEDDPDGSLKIDIKDIVGESTAYYTDDQVSQLLRNRILNNESTDIDLEIEIKDISDDRQLQEAHLHNGRYKDKDLVQFWEDHTLRNDRDDVRWDALKTYLFPGDTTVVMKNETDFRRELMAELLVTRESTLANKLLETPLDDAYHEQIWRMGTKFWNERREQYFSIKVQVHTAMTKGWNVGARDIVEQFCEDWERFVEDVEQAEKRATERKNRAELAKNQASLALNNAAEKLQDCEQQLRAAESVMRPAFVK